MRRDAVVGGEEVDQILGDIERLDGADAQALDESVVEDAAEQVEKFKTAATPAAPSA